MSEEAVFVELVLQKTAELILEQGFQGVKMKDIADAVGCSHTKLYTYFGSQAEIFRLLIEDQWMPLQEYLLRNLASGLNVDDCVKAILERRKSYFSNKPVLIVYLKSRSLFTKSFKQLDNWIETFENQMLARVLEVYFEGSAKKKTFKGMSFSTIWTVYLTFDVRNTGEF